MAAVAPAADQASDLLQKLSLDSQTKKDDAVEANKKTSSNPYGSVNGGEAHNMPIPSDRSLTPVLPEYVDPSMWAYSAYYYGGYDGSMNEWDSRYGNRDGVEMPPGVYGDMYHGYGYAPYGPYPSPGSPVPTVGHDGQIYPAQHYQYPAPFFQPPTPTNPTNQTPSAKHDLPTSVTSADNKPVVALDSNAKSGSDSVANGTANGKQSQQNGSVNSNGLYNRAGLQSGLSHSGYGFNGMQSPLPWFDGPMYSNGQHRPATSSVSSVVSHSSNSSARNQTPRPSPLLPGMHGQRPGTGIGPTAPSFMNRIYPDNRFYGQYGSSLKPGLGFGSNTYNSRSNGRWGLQQLTDNKYKPRSKYMLYGFGNESQDGFSELNRGPRSGGFKGPKPLGPTITLAVKGQALPTVTKQETNIPDREQFNKPDFPVTYSDAKFFIIKSYSEDDVHKSVKYNVWASTPNGNKKLDAGYREAQEKAGGCPVFLFFSVNTSGQFVGVAEMVGPVDFEKTVEYWQQDKWNGCFPLKWHIVKDVPNSLLKHITLDNNDNKPVTNSRDTQDVKLEQGLEMLKIFKDHVSRTSILDDFTFYENRQKLMQDRRAKQQQQQQIQNHQVWDERKDVVGEKENRLQKPMSKEAAAVVANGNLGERKLSEENGVGPVASDTLKIMKPPTEKRAVANGVAANGVAEGC